MFQYQTGFVNANSLRFHYYRTGGDKPALVLAHGMTDNGLCWAPVARVLAEDYDVIMYDARGHGLSDAPENGYAVTDHAKDLAGIIQALGLRKPRLMGHSMGAATIAVFAGRCPDIPERIVLEDPPPAVLFRTPTKEQQANTNAWRNDVIANKSKTRQELIEMAHLRSPAWSEEELGSWADAHIQVSPNVFNNTTPPDPGAIQKILAKIKCPVLLLTADISKGAILLPEIAEQFVAKLPNARRIHIPGAGHSIRREQYDLFMQAVTSFLSE